MNYAALFIVMFSAIALGMPVGQVLSTLADAGLRWYMDYRAERIEFELAMAQMEAEKEEEKPAPERRPVAPRTKRLDPAASERVIRSRT